MRWRERLNITWEKGSKGDGDKRYYVENKILTIRDMLRLNQLVAENERQINKNKIEATGNFYYQQAVHDAIEGKLSLDDICIKYQIPFI